MASLITYLADANEATSREIEMGTNLRQPEVSIGMLTLRQNNWIEQRNIKAEGKGRPMIVYKLRVPLESIINHYEGKSKQESAQAMMSIQRLKELTAVRLTVKGMTGASRKGVQRGSCLHPNSSNS